MATSTLEVVIKGRDLLTPTLNKVESGLKGLGTTADGLKGSILAGIGLGAGITGFGLLTEAIQRGVNVVGDMVRGAMEEEAGMARLNVALRDSVQGWDGNTKAIEDAIQARLRFGFTDDTLRQSIGTLVARTHDVNDALMAQTAAMDLARFRSIDLGTATDLIGKAWDGQTAALKRAGIQIDAGVSGMEAMSSILRVVSGQADAYANTSIGGMEAAQAKLDDSMNRLGERILPAVAGGFDILASSADGWAKAADWAASQADMLASHLTGLVQVFDSITYKFGIELPQASGAAGGGFTALNTQAQVLPGGLHGVEAGADNVASAMGRAAAQTNQAWFEMRRMHQEATTQNWSNITVNSAGFAVPTGPQDYAQYTLAQRTWIEQQKAAEAAAAAAAARKATADAIDRQREAINRVIEAIKRQDEAQETLFRRQIANLDRVIQKQLDAIDAARAARDEARQQAADAKDMKDAEAGLVEAQKSGSGEAILRAQERLKDIRARLEEEQTRKHEDELAKRLKDTQAYIDAVAQLESSATNRKALANTLSKREQVLEAQRSAALAAGDTDTVANLDMKLEAIRAAEKRNAQAMGNEKATAKAQEFVSVHTTINLDGKTIADVVDKYLYKH